MTIPMTAPSAQPGTYPASVFCPTLAVIDRDAGAMLSRALVADHLLLESAELGYLEAQTRNLIGAARSTCSFTRAR